MVLEPDCQHDTTAAMMYKQEPAAEELSTLQECKQDYLRNSRSATSIYRTFFRLILIGQTLHHQK